MILDSLENSNLYEAVNPRFKKAFDFLKSNDLAALPLGKIELEGTDLFVNIAEITGKTALEARMETHNFYIDIQVPVSKVETMGWKSGKDLSEITDVYNPEKDVAFFADKATNFIAVQPFQFAVFFPQDGHQPGIADGNVKKVIVKVHI